MLTDATVAAYLGMTEAQVHFLRKIQWHQCAGCSAVHPTFPIIRAYHSPVCPDQGRCRCGSKIEGAGKGHQVGLICDRCAE